MSHSGTSRAALVTGGASGFGAEVAKQLVRRGDTVCGRFNIAGPVGYSRQDRVDAAPRERAHRLVATNLPQPPHRRGSQVVICVAQLGPPGGRQSITLRGPAAAALLPGRGSTGLRVTTIDQGVKVPSHARGGDAEPLTDLTGGDGSGLQQQLDDLATRVAVNLRTDFHNTIVTELADKV